MKLHQAPTDGKCHVYCMRCGRETLEARRHRGWLTYRCRQCDYSNPRALIVDPAINWWLGSDDEYWHEVAGIFVSNGAGKFLFFVRTKFPFGLTVPAGHVDRGEKPLVTARRELHEETGLQLPTRAFTHVVTEDVWGDQCVRGSDAHRWHAFAANVGKDARLKVDASEGSRPRWLGLQQAMRYELTYVTRYMITRYARQIAEAAR